MKIACTADIHAFNYNDFSKIFMVEWDNKCLRYVVTEETESSKPMNSRLYYILNGLCDMRDYCFKENIRNILIAGDIFHHRETIEVTVYNAMYKVLESFKSMKLNIVAISGNHDDVDNSQIPITSLHPLREIMTVFEKPGLAQLRDNDEIVDVVVLPYSKDKEFMLSSMNGIRSKCAKPRESILMCHLGITGGEVGSGHYSMKDEYSMKELMYDKWKYLIAGHYHHPQTLAHNSLYTGSPLQNNFSDEVKEGNQRGYNGFWVIDTSKRWDMRFVPIKAPRFMTITPDELKILGNDVLVNDYVRVKSSAEDSEKLKKELEDILEETGADELNIRLELEKEYSSEQRSDIGISNTFEESVAIYAKEKYTGNIDVSRISSVGLEILNEVTSRV